MYKECPKKLADAIVNNDRTNLEPAKQPPEAGDVRRLYNDLWGRTGPMNLEISDKSTSELPLGDYFGPITVGEVEDRIEKIRKKSAAGPDGLLKDNLLIPGLPIILVKSFNMLWYSFYFPILCKENRTTLIPKPNKNASNVENWRPITIGSILSRMFSSILDGRLRSGITQNIRQKGFTSESRYKLNIKLMNAALDHCKRNRGGAFTIVDISKAFDTILHSAVRPCLARKGVPTPIIDLIVEMYSTGAPYSTWRCRSCLCPICRHL